MLSGNRNAPQLRYVVPCERWLTAESQSDGSYALEILGAFKVDPSTVKPIAVIVDISDDRISCCPNCECYIMQYEVQHRENEIKYCKWCGQRLKWDGGSDTNVDD